MKSPLLEGQHTQFYRLVHNWKIWFKKPIMPAIIFNLLVSIKSQSLPPSKLCFKVNLSRKNAVRRFKYSKMLKRESQEMISQLNFLRNQNSLWNPGVAVGNLLGQELALTPQFWKMSLWTIIIIAVIIKIMNKTLLLTDYKSRTPPTGPNGWKLCKDF